MADTPQEYFEEDVIEWMEEEPDAAKAINTIYQFNIEGDDGGTWVLDLTKLECREGEDPNAKCTVIVKDADFMDIVSGKLNPQMAFMSGKLRVEGDMSLALKLGDVLG